MTLLQLISVLILKSAINLIANPNPMSSRLVMTIWIRRMASASLSNRNLLSLPWNITGDLNHRMVWLGSPLGHIGPCTLPSLDTYQPEAFPFPGLPLLSLLSLFPTACLQLMHDFSLTLLDSLSTTHDFSPLCFYMFHCPYQGADLVTLLLSPTGSPWF
jgi:hypothetical protein